MWSLRRTPAGCVASRRTSGSRSVAEWCRTSRATSTSARPSWWRRSRMAAPSCSSPTPACRASSDPGYRLVAACVEAGLDVTAVPGPSAVLTALAVSGLPVDRFCFEGFAPRKAGERRRVFGALGREPRTMVFFESPHRTRSHACRDGGGLRRRPTGRRLPRAHQDVRGGRPGPAVRSRRLGREPGARRARRGDPGGRRRSDRAARPHRRRAPRARRRKPRPTG